MAAKLIIPDVDIQEETGRGGFGVLYRGVHRGKVVAIKIQKQALASNQHQRSWNRDAAALARLHHPALVSVLHVGKTDNRAFLIMEFAAGANLSTLLRKGPLSEPIVLKIGIALAEALAEVHRCGLIHRDVKPSNIIISENDQPKLIDFGLVAQVEDTQDDITSFVGSVDYCPPEQTPFIERGPDGRSDLYALGCVLFECLTGRPPFVEKDAGELLRQHAVERAPTVKSLNPDVSEELSAIIARLLAKDMDDRYQTGKALARALFDLSSKPQRLSLVTDVEPETDPHRFDEVPEVKLAGRESESDALKQAWDKARQGLGSVALVEGEPGSGKSRLVRSLLADVTRSGSAVLQGKCVKGEIIPFSFLKSVLDEHIQKMERQSSSEDVEASRNKIRLAAKKDAALLKRFSPGLGKLLADTADIGSMNDRFDQYPAAVAEFFLSLAKQYEGLAFFVDDIQWIDPASREVLKRIAKHLRSTPFLLVAAARDDVDNTSIVETIVADFKSELSARFTLGPLNIDGIRQIVAQQLGSHAISEGLITSIAARCNGNPFAINEYVRAMLDEGLLTFAWGNWVADTTGASAIILPNDVFALVLKRVGTLQAATKRILAVAAVLGTRINTEVLSQLCVLERQKVQAAMAEAVRASVMERIDADIFEFAHDRIRESLLKDMSPVEIQETHQTIAESLDALGLEDDSHIYAVAHHFQRGVITRRSERRYQVTALAGKRALDACANQESYDLLQSAIALASDAKVSIGWETYEALGEVCRRLSLIDVGVENLQKALAAAPRATDRSRIRILIGYCYLTILDAEHGWVHVEKAFDEAGQRAPRATVFDTIKAAMYGLFGICCMLTGFAYGRSKSNPAEPQQMMKLTQLAGVVAYYRLDPIVTFQASMRSLYAGWVLGFSKELALSYYGLGTILSFAGLTRASRHYFEKASAVANSLGDPMLLAECKLYEAYSINFGGRPVAAATAMTSVLSDYGRWLDGNNFSSGTADLSENLLFRGYFRESAKWTDELITLVESQRQSPINRPEMMTFYAKRATQLAVAGSVASGGKNMKLAGEIAHKYKMPMATGVYATIRILYHLELGELDCIDALIAERTALVPRDPGAPLLLQRYFYIVQGYARLAQLKAAGKEQRSDALKKFIVALRELKQCSRHGTFKPHYHVLAAALHWAHGRERRAFRELSRADLAANSWDNPWAHYEAAKIRAEILRGTDNQESAMRHLKNAIGMAQDHGWDLRARSLAEEFGIDRSRQASEMSTSQTGTLGSLRSVKVKKYLDVLMKTGQDASAVLDPEKQSQMALDQIIHALSAERGFLLLFEGNKTSPEVVCARDDKQQDIPGLSGFSANVINRVIDKKSAFVLTGTSQGVELGSASIVAKDLRSILAAPLMLGNDLKGVIYLDSRLAKGIFTEADIGMISAIASQIALVLETAQVAKLEIERRSLEKDMEVSGAVQSLLLPKKPRLQLNHFELSSFYMSASLSGGDWWWMHERKDKSLLLFLGDVTGHGVGAAMVAAAVAGSYRSIQALGNLQPVPTDVLLSSMNESLSDFCRGEFLMTYIAVEVFPDGAFRCWFGGGPAPAIINADGEVKKIIGSGNPLGLDPFEPVSTEAQLEPEQKLILYTDGIPEMQGANGKSLRNAGFTSMLRDTNKMNAYETTEHVKSRLSDFRKDSRLEDDATLIAMGRLKI